MWLVERSGLNVRSYLNSDRCAGVPKVSRWAMSRHQRAHDRMAAGALKAMRPMYVSMLRRRQLDSRLVGYLFPAAIATQFVDRFAGNLQRMSKNKTPGTRPGFEF